MILSKNVARFIGNLGGKKFTVFPIDVGGAIIDVPNLGKVYTNIDTGHFIVDTPPKALSALKKATKDIDCVKGTHYLTVEYSNESFGIVSNNLAGSYYASVGTKELQESLEFVLPFCATSNSNPSLANEFGDGSANGLGDGSVNELYWEPSGGLTVLRGSGYGFNFGLCFDDSRW